MHKTQANHNPQKGGVSPLLKADLWVLSTIAAAGSKRLHSVQISTSLGHVLFKTRLTRAALLSKLQNGSLIATALPRAGATSTYDPGVPIGIVKVQGTEYLRTDGAAKAEDQLDGVPSVRQ